MRIRQLVFFTGDQKSERDEQESETAEHQKKPKQMSRKQETYTGSTGDVHGTRYGYVNGDMVAYTVGDKTTNADMVTYTRTTNTATNTGTTGDTAAKKYEPEDNELQDEHSATATNTGTTGDTAVNIYMVEDDELQDEHSDTATNTGTTVDTTVNIYMLEDDVLQDEHSDDSTLSDVVIFRGSVAESMSALDRMLYV